MNVVSDNLKPMANENRHIVVKLLVDVNNNDISLLNGMDLPHNIENIDYEYCENISIDDQLRSRQLMELLNHLVYYNDDIDLRKISGVHLLSYEIYRIKYKKLL